MSDPFIAEIRMFAGNFAPRGWAFCNGQIMSIAQNTALFSLLGTTYGGDGRTTFALPNLQGRAPLQPGQGNGLSSYVLGETGGVETVTLLASEMPVHSHVLQAATTVSASDPTNKVLGKPRATNTIYTNAVPSVNVNPQAVAIGGGNLPHNNMQPYLVVNYIIALQGIFPPRS
jgi:microcystin-dependent protein